MGYILAVANKKGGSGKTTTTGALASCLVKKGYKVLAVDMDPQGDLTDWSGYRTEDRITVYDVLRGFATAKDTIVEREGSYDLLPADDILWNAMMELDVRDVDHLLVLKDALDTVKDKYDFIVIDTPPNFGPLAFNSYIAAKDGLIITSDTSAFATRALEELMDTLSYIRDFNKNAYPIGILLTKYTGRSRAKKTIREITDDFADYWNIPVFERVIRNTDSIAEAQMDAVDIFSTKNKLGATDYKLFTEELLEKLGVTEDKKNEEGGE